MSDIVRLPQPDPFSNGCPRCGRYTAIRNVQRSHWAYCEVHRFRWRIGSNLFSTWRSETDADWAANVQFLSCFADATGWRERTKGGAA